ncbi:MAG: hypothetical protein AVDCRST_MAG12-1023, partial [uncultured Rubrobacteraceae bacterium]
STRTKASSRARSTPAPAGPST